MADLVAPWVDMINDASLAATELAPFVFDAPGAALQQLAVNQVGYLGDLLNGNIGDVVNTIGTNLQDVFQTATFLGDLDAEFMFIQGG